MSYVGIIKKRAHLKKFENHCARTMQNLNGRSLLTVVNSRIAFTKAGFILVIS